MPHAEDTNGSSAMVNGDNNKAHSQFIDVSIFLPLIAKHPIHPANYGTLLAPDLLPRRLRLNFNLQVHDRWSEISLPRRQHLQVPRPTHPPLCPRPLQLCRSLRRQGRQRRRRWAHQSRSEVPHRQGGHAEH